MLNRKEQGEVSLRGELALMGYVIEVTNDFLPKVIDYIFSVLKNTHNLQIEADGESVVKESNKYCKAKPRYLAVNGIDDMIVLTIVKDKANILSDEGVLSYVYNVTVPWFSELGYTFFRKNAKGKIHRVG